MDPKKLRKKQIARRLGVSEQVLEQYLQLKRAEVLQPASTTPPTAASGTASGKNPTSSYGRTTRVDRS